MSVSVVPEQLRFEMTRRGWDAIDLARAARLSPATVSTALAGKAISAHSMTQIARALSQAPVNELIDRLVSRDNSGLGFA